MILSGTALSNEIRADLKKKTSRFSEKYGRCPCLAVVLVGDNPSSCIYVAGKKRDCDEIGFNHLDIFFDNSVSQSELIKKIDELNLNSSVDGILVQLPLPEHIDCDEVINSILPSKDVDGFTPMNNGKMVLGQKSDLLPCTPKGILKLLDSNKISTDGKNVCVLGRSNIVGKPIASLLMQRDRNATVTICNSRTENIGFYTKNADILISAVGKPNLVTKDMVKQGAVVIDVGMNRIEDSAKKSGYRLVGDVDFNNVSDVASAITPVPGGVGPMTIAMLMENTLIAACNAENTKIEEL